MNGSAHIKARPADHVGGLDGMKHICTEVLFHQMTSSARTRAHLAPAVFCFLHRKGLPPHQLGTSALLGQIIFVRRLRHATVCVSALIFVL